MSDVPPTEPAIEAVYFALMDEASAQGLSDALAHALIAEVLPMLSRLGAVALAHDAEPGAVIQAAASVLQAATRNTT